MLHQYSSNCYKSRVESRNGDVFKKKRTRPSSAVTNEQKPVWPVHTVPLSGPAMLVKMRSRQQSSMDVEDRRSQVFEKKKQGKGLKIPIQKAGSWLEWVHDRFQQRARCGEKTRFKWVKISFISFWKLLFCTENKLWIICFLVYSCHS